MFNNYGPMKFIKEMCSKDKNIEQNEPVTKEQDSINKYAEAEKSKEKSKYRIFKILLIGSIIFCGLIFLTYHAICLMPYEGNFILGDTPITISATYNSRYRIAKINLTIEEVIEDWQVKTANGTINEIKLECETNDKTVKREFKFKNIDLTEGEQVKGSITIDNTKLKDFVLIKDLLSGDIMLYTPKIISIDSKERDKIKHYYYYFLRSLLSIKDY